MAHERFKANLKNLRRHGEHLAGEHNRGRVAPLGACCRACCTLRILILCPCHQMTCIYGNRSCGSLQSLFALTISEKGKTDTMCSHSPSTKACEIIYRTGRKRSKQSPFPIYVGNEVNVYASQCDRCPRSSGGRGLSERTARDSACSYLYDQREVPLWTKSRMLEGAKCWIQKVPLFGFMTW